MIQTSQMSWKVSIFMLQQYHQGDINSFTQMITFTVCHPYHLSGYSDPYCMLGILVGQSPREMEEKKERKFSFRKRKEKLEKRSSTKEVLPAKCIQVTEVKPETLNPVWDEHFVLWVQQFNLHQSTEHGDMCDMQDSQFHSFHTQSCWLCD